MTLEVTDFPKTKQRNILKKFVDGGSSKTKGMNSLIDGLPVTIFRTLNDSSWAIYYMSENILELTGHSRMDFISKKLSWFDIVYPETIH